MENVIKTGYLKKGRQSNRFSLFRREPRRWYVFLIRDGNQPFLEYYEDEESSITSQPINSFNLSGCKQISYILATRNPSFTFCIVLEDRMIELTALTRTDLIDWCDRLETSLHHYGFLNQIRGPDEEHVYTEAPFLMRKKKQSTGSADGVHSSFNNLSSVNPENRDNYEEVPGMVLVPHYNRNARPTTIAVSPADIISFQLESDKEVERTWKYSETESVPVIFLNREIELDDSPFKKVSQQPRVTGDEEAVTPVQDESRKPVHQGSIVILEKDNSSLARSMSKKCQESSTHGAPNTIQKDMELTNGIQSDTHVSNIESIIQKDDSSSDESEVGEYEKLIDWTVQPQPERGQVFPHQDKNKDKNENDLVFNGDGENLKAFTEKMLIYQNTETVSHKSPVLKPLTSASPKSPNSLFCFDEELLTTEVSGDKSMLKAYGEPGNLQLGIEDTNQRQRTLSECLPDDENVHRNVRELLNLFGDGSGSYSATSESAEPYYGFYGTSVNKPLSDSVFSDDTLPTSEQNTVPQPESSPTKHPDTDLSCEPCANQSVHMPQYSTIEDSLPTKEKQNTLSSSSKIGDNFSTGLVVDKKSSVLYTALPPVPKSTPPLYQSEVNNNASKTPTLDLNLAQRSSASSGDINEISGSPLDSSPGKTDMLTSGVSLDLGYISEKTGSMEKDNPGASSSTNLHVYNPLPIPLYIKREKTVPATSNGAQFSESLEFPPPLPVRTVRRQRPLTSKPSSQSQEEAEEGYPRRPPRRSLSLMQQVSSTTAAQSVVPLKLTQAELLRQKVCSPLSTPVELRRKDCLGTIAFVNAFGCVWIVGWNLQARPRLHSHFQLGDRLISINNQPISSASAAQKFIKQSTNENLVLEVKTAPKAKVIAITRSIAGQSLGLKRDGGTAEIIYVDPNGLSAGHGLPGRAPTIDNTGTCSWVITEINSRPLNLFLKKNEIEIMLNAVGMNISFVVQPSDFINELKKQIKHLKSYKDFLLG